MANILVKPYDSVDLSLLLTSYGAAIATFYPVAYVYDPSNNLVDGAPFTLLPVANNLYVLNNAFQAKVDSGSYKVIYLVYIDAAHTTRSTEYGEMLDTITVSIQAVSGGSNLGGGDSFYDDTNLIKYIKNFEETLTKKIVKLQKDFDNGLKVEIPPLDTKKIEFLIGEIKSSMVKGDDKQVLAAIKTLQEMTKSSKGKMDDLMNGIKQNRSAIIKGKFDKSQMIPILETVANMELKMNSEFSGMRIDLTKTIDLKNSEMAEKFSSILEKSSSALVDVMESLNESIRIKLKFTLDALKMLVLGGRQPKNNIHITLKKDE